MDTASPIILTSLAAPDESSLVWNGKPRLTWAPPQSPISIEYPPGFLQDLRRQAHRKNTRGILHGVQEGSRIEVHAARPDAGLRAVGIFVVRVRGEVFLTEADLEFLDASGAPIALVIAGGRGGFFVWETARHKCGATGLATPLESAKGAARTAKEIRNCFAPHGVHPERVLREFLKSSRCIQSIQSYQEFSLMEESPVREPSRIAGILCRSLCEIKNHLAGC